MEKIFWFYPLPSKSAVAGKFPTRFRLITRQKETMKMSDFKES
jgi:hypothetical protein